MAFFYNKRDCCMFREYDKVFIKNTGISGEIVDIYEVNNIKIYTVESDERGVPGGIGYDGDYKLFHCKKEELQLTHS